MSLQNCLIFVIQLFSIIINGEEWVLLWEDNFDGTELNMTNWNNTRFQSHGYPDEMQYYIADNVYLEDGNLVLKTLYDPTFDPDRNITYPYTSGVVTSSGKFYTTYGKWEVRAKLPTPSFSHLWPAIWFQKDEGPCYQEIDLMEQWVGQNDNDVFMHYIYHNSSECGPSLNKSRIDEWPGNGTIIDFSKDFHIWTMEWNKTSIGFWIDDNYVAYRNSSDGTMPYQPAYVILNTAVCGANWCGGPNGIPKNITAYFYIDYVRVYQLGQ